VAGYLVISTSAATSAIHGRILSEVALTHREAYIFKFRLVRFRIPARAAAPILSALAILLPGCAAVHTDYLLLDPQTCHKAGYPIDIYYEQPTFAFTAVAKVEAVKNRYRDASWEEVKVKLCREAYELDLDVDGLIGIQDSSVSQSGTIGPIGTGGATEKLTAIAIRYDQTVE
jgi:hypothetical protein